MRALNPNDQITARTSQHPRLIHKHHITPAEQTLLEIQRQKDQFATKSSDCEDDICNAVDRSAVLHIYNNAMGRLRDIPDKHHQIASECNLKVRIVLGLLNADPDHPAFLAAGQLLSPLEPQYANPRIDPGDDDCSYRAQWRLKCWRKEGWPVTYPGKAIKIELTSERLVGRNSMTDAELRKVFYAEEGILEEAVRRRIAAQTNGGDEQKRENQQAKDVRERSVPAGLRHEELDIDADNDDEMDMEEELASWENSDNDENHEGVNLRS
jgi:hypothetical protein